MNRCPVLLMLVCITLPLGASARSAQLADRSMDIDALEHPYILFSRTDIPGLIERTRTPPHSLIWERVVSRSPAATDGVTNAFIYALTGDEARGQAAKQVLADLCALPSWGAKAKLDVSEKCRPAGLIYDMIYHLLTPEERASFSQTIAEAGIKRLYSGTFDAWWSARRQHNYSPVFNSAYGLAAMAILTEKPEAAVWIERAADRIQLFLNSQDPAGGFGEGINYWCMSMRSIFPFLEGWRHLTAADLYEEPYLRDATGYVVLYSLAPDRASSLNFNDGGINRIYDPHVLVRLAATGHWPQLAWIVKNDLANTLPSADGQMNRFRLGSLYSFLWYDPDVPTKPLSSLPRSRAFPGIGWAVMRSGWEADALQLGVASSPKAFGNHDHADRGSIILNAFGERFICDAGKPTTYSDPLTTAWFRSSVAHNVLLVDGVGQTRHDHLSGPGRMSRFMSTEAFDYVLTENAGPYDGRVTRWDRHVFYAVPGAIVLLDQIELAEPGTASLLFHSPGPRAVLLESERALFPGDGGQGLPSLTGGKRRLAAEHGPHYAQTDWWRTGQPMTAPVDWDPEEDSADLALHSISRMTARRDVLPGFQDYRYPATYLRQSYDDLRAGTVLTLLVPRSADMKAEGTVPRIQHLSADGMLAAEITRPGRRWLLLARDVLGHLSAEDDAPATLESGSLSGAADVLAAAFEGDDNPVAGVLVRGTAWTFGAELMLQSDQPVWASFTRNSAGMHLLLEVSSPTGADLRLRLPQTPRALTTGGRPAPASFTPARNLAERHFQPGLHDIVIATGTLR